MMRDASVYVVVNPASSNGRTGMRWPSLRPRIEAALGPVEHGFTTRGGEGETLAAGALAAGFQTIVSLGGDGTHSEVVNGFLSGPFGDRVFVPLTSGTGGDFRKTFGVGPGPEAALAHLQGAEPRPLDAGSYTFVDRRGQTRTRAFVNILSVGMGGLVDEKVNTTSKALGGKTSFFIGTLRAMLAYRNVRLRISLDGGEPMERTVMTLALANGRFFGGGMMVAPDAQPDDGLLDVVILGDLSKREILGLSGSIYKGRHLGHPKVERFRARTVTVESPDPALLDVDGEPLGRCPITVTLRPQALRIRV